MSTFLDSYPIFENNQVLTSSQLNQLVEYLDEQNRLTRVQLIGDGIACGYELSFQHDAPPYELTIFQGLGITSAGYIIKEGDCVIHNYRPYNLPKGCRYVPFEDPDTTVQDVKLWELLTDDAPTLPTDVISPLHLPSGFTTDKVVLLFLEIIDVDLKSCLGKACDENGMQREFHLRKLLIGKKDLDKVIRRTCSQTGLYPSKYDLPEVFMKRALFTNDAPTPNTTNYFSFSQTYINSLKSTARPAIGVTIYDQIFRALNQCYVDFSPILTEYGGVNPFSTYPLPLWTNYINGSSAGPKYFGMQYFYDFLKDLILAYNEFRDIAFELMSECCIDMDCFPQHLMLGELVNRSASCKPSKYRHYFLASPIINNQKEKVDRAKFLFKRMVLMVQKFDLPTINNPNTVIITPNKVAVPIYITPSEEKRDPLSRRSMPYYFRVHETSTGLGTLEQSWSYDYKLKCLFSKGVAPLGYGNQAVNQTADQGPVNTPLFYDTDKYPFYRIEGHFRAHKLAAQQVIEQIKTDFDLPFNVISLRLNGDSFDNIAERCNFSDLRTEYGVIRVELLSLLNDVFNRFGVISGGHPVYSGLPHFMDLLINDANSGQLQASIHQPLIGFSSAVAASFSDSATAVTPGTADAGSSTARTAAVVGVGTVSALPVFPVFAARRTMSQAKTKLDVDILNLLTAIDIVRSQFLPFNISDFRFGYHGAIQDSIPGFIQNYNTALQAAINVKVGFNQILDLILRNTKVRNTPELYMDLSAYWQEVMGLLERFITDAKYKSLTFVNYSFQYRVNQLKANDMTVFSNFIKKHPGVEHMAGVPKGGTFILVYPGNAVAVDPIKRNYVVGQIRAVKEAEKQNAQLRAKPVMSVDDHAQVAQNDALIVNFDLVSQDIALPAVPIQKFAIEADQVIADFALPYLCCCDCECDDIKHPTEETQLGIPALAVPFYVQYSLGDYAFGKDVDVAVQNFRAKEFPIDIIPMLQYDKATYDESQIRLYLVNKFGKRLPASMPSMQTGNYANEPNTGAPRGIVTVANSAFSKTQAFTYTFAGQGGELSTGIDSFYYVFDIVDDNGTVLEVSTMGKVTVDILGRA
ncbi:MAG: hypothetical protein ACJ77K_09490 [Bacteroidia bacterium]